MSENIDKNNDQIENENIKPEISDLQEEVKGTRKLQVIAVISVAIMLILFMAISLLNRLGGGEEEEKEEKQEIGTKIKTNPFAIKEQNNSTPLKELVLPSKVVEEEEKSPFAPVAARPHARVLKSSSSLLVEGSGGNGDFGKGGAAVNGNGFVDFTSGEYTISNDGKVVQKADVQQNYNDDKDYENGVFTPKAAKKGQFDPNLYLAKGTYIGCSLDTRLVSTIKGGISCTVSEDVYSSNGVTLLIEKGSRITGYFVNSQMDDGMDRIFVTWNEIRTPHNIIIPVSSGASDPLGGSGMEGYVDHHWMTRFSSAILLSVIDDALNVILNGGRGTKNNQNIDYTEHTRETTRNMAETALQKFINIQPTLYKNHGDIVGVYVNRDIDFSKVYRLKIKKRG